MNRRAIAIIILVVGLLLLSVVGILFINSQDSSDNTPQPPPQQTPEVNEEGTPLPTEVGAPPPEDLETLDNLPPMVEVVVSLQTVPRGWLMQESELTTDMRVASEIPSNVITNIEDVIGLYARTDIFQGETLTADDLVEDITLIGVEEYGPTSLIPQGFIAMGVPMDRLSGVAYALEPGDYIDIMVTFFFYQIDEQFQTYLPNSAVLFLNEDDLTPDEGEELPIIDQEVVIISPFGRFEELPTGELVHVSPSEPQRPIPISMVLQNARVINVGPWAPESQVILPTPTPEPVEEGEEEPTVPPSQITPTAQPPEVLLVALSPQQQLFLKYAVESEADIDFALRGVNDGQLYEVENIDLSFFLERYNIEVPPNFNYSVDAVLVTVTVTPTPEDQGETIEQRPGVIGPEDS